MVFDSKNRKVDDVNKVRAKLDEATAALAEATKQEKDEEKKQADAEAGFIMFVVSSASLGLVSKCRIPTAAVAQRGLFRILLGSGVIVDIIKKDVVANVDPYTKFCPLWADCTGTGNFHLAEVYD